ncbi:MAG TPA: recombinase, partial [Actinobacteria bacterium]|nr:recombinase [Actinomycetota bacterium]
FDITLFYYNPNIYPEKEYFRRLKDIRKLSEISGTALIIGKYESIKWFKAARHLSKEPEGGKRCRICFDMRLEKTAAIAKDRCLDIFSTTLSISPHKNSKIINELGISISYKTGIDFYGADFKKKDGFKKTMDISRNHGFYHQNYCGCIYSIRKTD